MFASPVISAGAGVVLAGRGELGSPELPVLGRHRPGDVAGALGETVQLGERLGGRAAGLDAVAGQVVVGGQRGVDGETRGDAAQPGLVVADHGDKVSRRSDWSECNELDRRWESKTEVLL